MSALALYFYYYNCVHFVLWALEAVWDVDAIAKKKGRKKGKKTWKQEEGEKSVSWKVGPFWLQQGVACAFNVKGFITVYTQYLFIESVAF